MIFGILELEDIVQVNDKTRLSGTKSYISKDEAAVTLVRIEPEATAGYVTVTGSSYKDWYLDWQYATNGTKTVTIEITTDGAPQTFTKDIEVRTAAEDALWSSDADLIQFEQDLMKWTRPGRASFLDFHRKAQQEILFWLDEQRIWDDQGERFEKEDLIDTQEVKRLSINWTLKLIFFSLSNQTDDVFFNKSKYYESQAQTAQNRGRLLIDYNKDGELDIESDNYEMRSMRLLRR